MDQGILSQILLCCLLFTLLCFDVLVNTKYISSRELKTSKFSFVLRAHENSDVFNTLDEIYTETIKLCPLDVYVCQFQMYESISFKFSHYQL